MRLVSGKLREGERERDGNLKGSINVPFMLFDTMAFYRSFEISSLKTKNWSNSPISQLLRSCLAEFVGTAILVIFTCGACTSTSGKSDTLVATALSFGLTVTCLVATLGHVR